MCSEVGALTFRIWICCLVNSKCYLFSLKILWNTFERRLMGPGHNSPLWECLQFGSWKICFIKCPIRRSGVASDLPNNLISVKDKHKTCLIEKIENVFMKICRLKITYVSISFHSYGKWHQGFYWHKWRAQFVEAFGLFNLHQQTRQDWKININYRLIY